MAHDYEDVHDLDDLDDSELRQLVVERLAAHPGLDANDIDVRVEEHCVHLGGRIGTEQELRIAERVVTDVLGLTLINNELLVDPLRRAESPEPIDDHLLDEERRSGTLLGDRPVPLSPEAEHLREDLDARLFGTRDVQKAIGEGMSWVPPEGPTPEGLSDTDTTPGALGEDH